MKLIALASGLFFVAGNAMAAVKTCQTAAEIKMHIETNAPEEFCFHKVVDPKVSLVVGRAISADMQLAPNLEVAFLNTYENFDGAQASCAGLGAGWHAPASNRQDADPRASDNTNSLEAEGEYFSGATRYWFWSPSTVSDYAYLAWYVEFADGDTTDSGKSSSYYVVCVRPLGSHQPQAFWGISALDALLNSQRPTGRISA